MQMISWIPHLLSSHCQQQHMHPRQNSCFLLHEQITTRHTEQRNHGPASGTSGCRIFFCTHMDSIALQCSAPQLTRLSTFTDSSVAGSMSAWNCIQILPLSTQFLQDCCESLRDSARMFSISGLCCLRILSYRVS